MFYSDDITNLKTNITNIIGQKIIVKGTRGRSKVFEKEATIEKTYPNWFKIKFEDNDKNDTYTYKDVLTRAVELDVFDGEQYTPLIPPAIETKKVKQQL